MNSKFLSQQSRLFSQRSFKETPSSRLSDTIKRADIFSQEISLMFENGKSKLQTHCGVVFGVVMFTIILIYTHMKLMTMINYGDNVLQEPAIKSYFDNDFVYNSHKDGFRIAFGLTAYDSSSDPTPFDESFGELGVYVKTWGEKDADGNWIPTYFKKLETVPCQESIVNWDGQEDAKGEFIFWEPSSVQAGDIKRFYNKLQCLANDDLEL